MTHKLSIDQSNQSINQSINQFIDVNETV